MKKYYFCVLLLYTFIWGMLLFIYLYCLLILIEPYLNQNKKNNTNTSNTADRAKQGCGSESGSGGLVGSGFQNIAGTGSGFKIWSDPHPGFLIRICFSRRLDTDPDPGVFSQNQLGSAKPDQSLHPKSLTKQYFHSSQ